MRTASKTADQRASAAAIKERRSQDAAQAMRDYEAQRIATRAKTERLRALRLARDAEVSDLASRKIKATQE
jgi:hypothetical protein